MNVTGHTVTIGGHVIHVTAVSAEYPVGDLPRVRIEGIVIGEAEQSAPPVPAVEYEPGDMTPLEQRRRRLNL